MTFLEDTWRQFIEYINLAGTGEIARREGWLDSKVSQVKSSIARKLGRYL